MHANIVPTTHIRPSIHKRTDEFTSLRNTFSVMIDYFFFFSLKNVRQAASGFVAQATGGEWVNECVRGLCGSLARTDFQFRLAVVVGDAAAAVSIQKTVLPS